MLKNVDMHILVHKQNATIRGIFYPLLDPASAIIDEASMKSHCALFAA